MVRHPTASPPRTRAALLLATGILAAAAPLHAQTPGFEVTTAKDLVSEFQSVRRKQINAVVQDWTTLWERDDAALLARYYTDAALLLTPELGAIAGRDAIRAAWVRLLPERAGLQMEITEALSGDRLAFATGRYSYLASDANGATHLQTGYALLLFEEQRDRWLLRAQAFAPSEAEDPLAAPGRDAIGASRRTVYPPERTHVRLTLAPYLGNSSWQTRPGQASWMMAGAGLGLELGRALEFRGHYWKERGTGGVAKPLEGYGGELIAFAPSLWRVQPQVLAGASKLSGSTVPDSLVVPLAGVGLGIRLTNAISADLVLREYFPRAPDAPENEGWGTLHRERKQVLSGGLRLAIGRQPVWRDPPPSPGQSAFEAEHAARIMDVLREGLQGGANPEQSPYTVGAILLEPGKSQRRGPEAIRQFWADRGGERLSVHPIARGASGRVAFAIADVMRSDDSAGPSERASVGRLLTVLEEVRGRWLIRAQSLTPVD